MEDPNTGALYLSYFTGNGTEFYGLYPQWDANGEIDSFRAGKLGNLQEGVWPVALYTAESTDVYKRQVQRRKWGIFGKIPY